MCLSLVSGWVLSPQQRRRPQGPWPHSAHSLEGRPLCQEAVTVQGDQCPGAKAEGEGHLS